MHPSPGASVKRPSRREQVLLARLRRAALDPVPYGLLQQFGVPLKLREDSGELAHGISKRGCFTLQGWNYDAAHVANGAQVKAAFPAKPYVVDHVLRHFTPSGWPPNAPGQPGASVKRPAYLFKSAIHRNHNNIADLVDIKHFAGLGVLEQPASGDFLFLDFHCESLIHPTSSATSARRGTRSSLNRRSAIRRSRRMG